MKSLCKFSRPLIVTATFIPAERQVAVKPVVRPDEVSLQADDTLDDLLLRILGRPEVTKHRPVSVRVCVFILMLRKIVWK